MLNWMKANRKKMNAGTLKVERVEKFIVLLALCEQYKHINQYMWYYICNYKSSYNFN